MIKKIYIEFLFLVLLGALSSLSLPPFNYLVINFFTFTFFFVFLMKKSEPIKANKIFFLYGWFFGFGYFLSSLYWVSISLSFDQNYKHLVPFTVIFLPALLGVFYGFISFFFKILKTKNVLSSFFIFSLIFGIIEFVRGSIFTGFPWNLIAYSFTTNLEVLSIITITGTYGFNLLCISLFTSPALFLIKDSKKNILVFIASLFLFILFYGYGLSYKQTFNNADIKELDYKIRIIGSNISLDRFYLNIEPVSIIEELIELSDPTKKEKTIFVWPEGILPDINQDELINYNWLFKENFSENHLFILGINNQIIKKNDKNYFNTLSIYDNKFNLLHSYNKINLVPFGEFIPFEKILDKIGLKTLTNNYQSFSKGNQRDIIEIDQQNFILKILPLICYEIIYSGKLFDNNNFDIIINISEDGWFGKSIGPKQHFNHSIMRAIESGKYLVRSSNNGIAAIINPLGVSEKKVKFNNSGYIDLIKIKKIQPTIFSIYGNKIFVILILLYIFLIFSFNRNKNE